MNDADASPAFEKPPVARQVGIGCFMAFVGLLSAAMVGVLLSKGVALATRAPKCDGIPTCDWHWYAGIFGLLGAVSLPWLIVTAMRQPAPPQDETSELKN